MAEVRRKVDTGSGLQVRGYLLKGPGDPPGPFACRAGPVRLAQQGDVAAGRAALPGNAHVANGPEIGARSGIAAVPAHREAVRFEAHLAPPVVDPRVHACDPPHGDRLEAIVAAIAVRAEDVRHHHGGRAILHGDVERCRARAAAGRDGDLVEPWRLYQEGGARGTVLPQVAA